MEFCRLDFVGLRLKVHRLEKGYTWVSKRRDFTEDQREEILGNKNFSGLGDVLKTSFGFTTLQEVGILPTLVYFYHKGLISWKMWCRGPKALFGWFRNCLKPFLWIICSCGLPKM